MKINIENVTNSIARKGGVCLERALTKTKVAHNYNKKGEELQGILDTSAKFGYVKKVKNGRHYKYYAVKHTVNID